MTEHFHVASRKGLFTFAKANGRWAIARTAFLGDPVSMVLEDPRDGAIYAALNHGHFGAKVHRSDDAGQSWNETATPTFPPKPDDVPVIRDTMRDLVIPWDLKMIWALEIDPATEGGLWCGTIPGGLFHSADKGASWQLNRPLWDLPERAHWTGGGYDYPGIHSILVDPTDAQRVLLGVSVGGAWLTEDAGQTWAVHASGMRAEYLPPEQAGLPEAQDPHIIVRCPGEPNIMWCQHHNGIFVTVDGARSWREMEQAGPSTFGFAAAVHPRRGDTAWFVPAIKDEKRIPVDGKVVVTRTTDGGKTFETLAKGLPQSHAYDLIYRHALDIDSTGECLAMGSTTGSIWISEDGGDSWQTLSSHLPPVYAVRFARPS